MKVFTDESNLIQARCVLKENLCGEGYYLMPNDRCSQCDEACELCHGAGINSNIESSTVNTVETNTVN